MKIAYFGINPHPVNLERQLVFARHFGFEVIEEFNINKLPTQGNIYILITDHCELPVLKSLRKWSKRKKNVRFIVWTLELYSLSYKSRVNEYLSRYNNKIRRNWVKALIREWIPKIYLFRSIISGNKNIVIASSRLRVEYLKNKFNKHISFFVIRNKPTFALPDTGQKISMNDLTPEIKKLITSKKFLFSPGSINNFEDFKKVCQFAYVRNLKIIVATKEDKQLTDIHTQFPQLIYNLGNVSNGVVQSLVKICTAGVCLYRNNSENQKLSASSKLFEFLLFNKSVIVSNNDGVIDELSEYPDNLAIFVDRLECTSIPETKLNINKEYLFQNELESLNGFLE
jgi:hypothetical protein